MGFSPHLALGRNRKKKDLKQTPVISVAPYDRCIFMDFKIQIYTLRQEK